MDQGKSSTYIPVDLDRLHKVYTGGLTEQKADKTFAKCCEVISLLHLKKSTIICLMKFFKDFYEITFKITELLTKENIVFKIENQFIKGITNCGTRFIIHFVADNVYDDFIRGKDFYLVDFTDY
jgi:hypothetical protein